MKLSDWARKHGLSSKTAWQWWRTGILPVRARPRPTGTMLVEEAASPEAAGETVVEARGSSADQKRDRPVVRLVGWATARGMRVDREGADDRVRDVVEGLTAARLYGGRSARRRARRALEAMG